MTAHPLVALATLVVASWFDLRQRRIPNRLLVFSTIIHGATWFLFSTSPELASPQFVFYLATVIIILLMPPLRRILLTSMGMGDVKLIGYLLLFLGPFLMLERWLIALAIVSGLTTIWLVVSDLRQRRNPKRDRGSIPFAPLLLVATLFSFSG